MLHALLPAYIHRQSDEHLLELIQACELALLDGTSTHGDMTTLVECEKEMLQREHRRVRRTLVGLRPQDYVNPKVSLSSLAAKHPVDLPAEAFDTDSGTTRSVSDAQVANMQSDATATGRRARGKLPQAKPAAAKSAPRPDAGKTERFNLRKAVARRFGAKQVVAEKADVKHLEKKARVPQRPAGARQPQAAADPTRAKRVPAQQAVGRPTNTRPSSAVLTGTKQPRAKITQTARRLAPKPILVRDLQD